MTSELDSLVFRTLDSLKAKEVLVPYLEHSIMNANFPEVYDIKVRNKEHGFDGYFHPSTDANSSPLYLYNKFISKGDSTRIQPDGLLAMQIGSAIHSLLESLLVMLGFCDMSHVEQSFVNKERKIKGTLDLTDVFSPHVPEGIAVDIKTCAFLPRELSDPYKAQGLLYMDNHPDGPRDKFLFLFIEKSFPHKMRELILTRGPEEEKILQGIYDKFELVLDCVKRKDPSELKPCCNFDSATHTSCSMRNMCKIGKPSATFI